MAAILNKEFCLFIQIITNDRSDIQRLLFSGENNYERIRFYI